MEHVEIQSGNKDQAKRVRKMATANQCIALSTKIPDNSKEGIIQTFQCPQGVSDKIMESVKEPGIIEESLPDKLMTPIIEYNVKKTRRF